MAPLTDALASFLNVPVSGGLASVAFSVALVAWLVMAEEVELRRNRRPST